MLLFSDSWMDTWTQPRGGKNLTNLKADLRWFFCVKASLMLIIHCGRLEKPLRRSAFKFSSLEVKPQYKLAKYAWQCSCTAGDQIYGERSPAAVCEKQWALWLKKKKITTTVLQMYSNSLPSRSIHTPTRAFCLQMQQMLFCCFFFVVFFLITDDST